MHPVAKFGNPAVDRDATFSDQDLAGSSRTKACPRQRLLEALTFFQLRVLSQLEGGFEQGIDDLVRGLDGGHELFNRW